MARSSSNQQVPDLVFVKTEAGVQEIEQRATDMSRPMRYLLIMVDGTTPLSQLVAQLPVNQSVPSMLSDLYQMGFVARVRGEGEGTVSPALFGDTVAPMESPIAEVTGAVSPQFRAVSMSPMQANSITSLDQIPAGVVVASPMSADVRKKAKKARRNMLLRFWNAGLNLIDRLGVAWWRFKGKFRRKSTRYTSTQTVNRIGLFITVPFFALIALSIGLPWIPLPGVPALAENYMRDMCGGTFSADGWRVIIWPVPKVSIHNISQGGQCFEKAQKLDMETSWSSILRGDMDTTQLDVVGAEFKLEKMMTLKASPSMGRTPLITFSDLTVHTTWVSFDRLSGEMLPSAKGPKELSLLAEDNRFRLNLSRHDDGVVDVDLRAKSFRVPFGGDRTIDDMVIQGKWKEGALEMNEFGLYLANGGFKGQGKYWIDDGSHLQLDLNSFGIDASQLFAGTTVPLRGNLEGKWQVTSSAATWEDLPRQIAAVGDINVTEGELVGIDVLDLSRRASDNASAGGFTRFATLQGKLSVDNSGWRIENWQLAINRLSVTGYLRGDMHSWSGLINIDPHQAVIPSSVWVLSGPPDSMMLTRQVGSSVSIN